MQVIAPYSIGELAELSGLPVKTIRYYADIELLKPDRTEAGHRRFGEAELARLQLVRSLRDLGVDLTAIGKVLSGHDGLGEVLRAHIATVETNLRGLQRQLAVLKAASASPSEDTVRRIQALSRLQAAERRQLLEGFWDRVYDGLPSEPELEARFRQAGTPELPADPSAAQLDAWLELAELATDEEFIETTRRNATRVTIESHGEFDSQAWMRATQDAAARAMKLMGESVQPADPRADEAVRVFTAGCAAALGREDGPDLRAMLARQIELGSNPKAGRYWALVNVIRGEVEPPEVAEQRAAMVWLFEALRHHAGEVPSR